MKVTLDLPLPLPILAFLGLAAAAAAVLSYSLTRRAATPGVRGLLSAIRLAALALALFCLAGPSSAGGDRREERPPVLLLFDGSRSLAIKDEAEGRSRVQVEADLLRELRPVLDRLALRYEVSVLGFGKETFDLPAAGPTALAPETWLGSVLAEMLTRVRGRRLAPVLVVTDGVNTGGRDPQAVARAFAATQHPIDFVGLGGAAGEKVMDRRVRSLTAPTTALLHSVVPVHAELTFHGCRGQSVPVRVTCDGKSVEERQVSVVADRQQVRIDARLKADETGQHRITVEVARDEREIDPTNNVRSTFFFVGRTTLKLLLLEGGPRWEAKYLARGLEGVEGITLEVRRPGAGGVLALGDAAELGTYHAILLGDVKAAALGAAGMQALREAVDKNGTGLLMLGGLENFGAGGFGGTPVGELLPVRLADDTGQRRGNYTLRKGASAPVDFLLSLAEKDPPSADAWQRLPALDGGVGFGPAKPGAEVLLEANDGRPILVSQTYGRGRAAAFASDSTWRWILMDAKGQELHRRFWRQLVLWLARQDQRGERNFWLALERFQFLPGDEVDVAAYLVGPGDRFLPDARLESVLAGPKGESPLGLAVSASAYRARLVPEEPGEYRISARATATGGAVSSDEVRFVVAGSDAELDDPAPDLELLKTLAESTGGRYLRPAEVLPLLEKLAARDERNIVERRRVRPLWDNLYVVLLFAALLVTEWLVRRSRRLP
ncbi:MAG: hypothetical protein HYZ53_05020 [Planctomycetes bacterium]|nr:hypothetical protein [Planctomycetota bacterium]